MLPAALKVGTYFKPKESGVVRESVNGDCRTTVVIKTKQTNNDKRPGSDDHCNDSIFRNLSSDN